MQIFYDLGHKAVCNPVSLISTPILQGAPTLLPKNELFVGFAQDLERGDIIGQPPETFFKVDILLHILR